MQLDDPSLDKQDDFADDVPGEQPKQEFSASRRGYLVLATWQWEAPAGGHRLSAQTVHIIKREDVYCSKMFFSNAVSVAKEVDGYLLREEIFAEVGSFEGHGQFYFDMIKSACRSGYFEQKPWLHRFLTERSAWTRLTRCNLTATLGAPGTDKSVRMAEQVRTCVLSNKRSLILVPTNELRNRWVSKLHWKLGPELFKRVRVLGHRELDSLAASRTLGSLTWERMQPTIASQETLSQELVAVVYAHHAAQVASPHAGPAPKT